MTVHLHTEESGNLIEIQVSGKLVKGDYDAFVPEFERLVKRFGKINVLFEMVDFHGWTAAALWEDLKFDLKHFKDIERLAMVGDKKWEKGMSVFCKPFTSATIRYFDQTERDQALLWLGEEVPSNVHT